MSPIRLLTVIANRLHLKKILLGLAIVYVVCCFLLYKLDPGIGTLANAFWFGFILVTTIGFGDFTVTEPAARVVAVILGLYGDFTITFITGIITSWIYERWQHEKGQSVTVLLDHLENLPDLEQSQLDHVQQQMNRK